MHASHIENCKTLYANLTRGMRDDIPAEIGGGTFGYSEQCTLRILVARQLCDQFYHGSEHDRENLRDIVARIRRDVMEGA